MLLPYTQPHLASVNSGPGQEAGAGATHQILSVTDTLTCERCIQGSRVPAGSYLGAAGGSRGDGTARPDGHTGRPLSQRKPPEPGAWKSGGHQRKVTVGEGKARNYCVGLAQHAPFPSPLWSVVFMTSVNSSCSNIRIRAPPPPIFPQQNFPWFSEVGSNSTSPARPTWPPH